jgi:hypothetical protein
MSIRHWPNGAAHCYFSSGEKGGHPRNIVWRNGSDSVWTELRAGRLNLSIDGSLDNDRGNWNRPSYKAVDVSYYSLKTHLGD